MNFADFGKAWEGRMVEDRLPLKQWLAGSDHSFVFLTELAGPDSPKAVVKVFPADFFEPDRQLVRWRAAAKLSHPSLLRLIDGGRSEIDNTPFFFVVTDFAEEDLSQILPQRALTADEVKGLLPSVLDALEYLHQHGFVHGHLRPSNIMASGDQVKLPVERIQSATEATDKNSDLTAYDAPELRERSLSPAADIWSLGMTLVATLKQGPLLVDPIQTAPLKIPADIAEPLRSIIGDCLALQPDKRCSIAEIRARLRPVPATNTKSQAPLEKKEKSAEVKSAAVAAAPAPALERPGPEPAPNRPPQWRPVRQRPTPPQTVIPPSRSPWRVITPVAVIVLFAAAILGPKLLSHHSEATPPASTSAPPSTEPNDTASTTNVAAGSASESTVVHRVTPNVSPSARRTIHGVIQIKVKVEVDPSGKVSKATITKPSTSAYFSRLALQAAQEWTFSPAQSDGHPVASAWSLHFQFSRNSTEVSPSRIAN